LKIGNYGKTIINNSSIKCIFNLEEDNILSLSDNIDLNQKEQIEIRNLKRGESLIIAENNKIIIKIISNSLENNLIEGNLKENHEQQLQ
jgi:hypothetical protein